MKRTQKLCTLVLLILAIFVVTPQQASAIESSLDLTFNMLPGGGADISVWPGDANCSNYFIRVTEISTGKDTDYQVSPSVATFVPNVLDDGSFQVQAFGSDVNKVITHSSPKEIFSPTTNQQTWPPSMAVTGASTLSIWSLSEHDFFVNMNAVLDSLPTGCIPTPGDFQVFEDGVLQQNYLDVNVSGGTRLLDLVFIIDNSGSMGNEIADVIANVGAFAQALADSNVDFRLALVRFGYWYDPGEYPVLINNGSWTNDAQDFKDNYLNQMYASGSTEYGIQAVIDACDGYSYRPSANRFFLLITDEDSDGGDKSEACTKSNNLDIMVNTAVNCSFGTSEADYCGPGSIRDCTNGLSFPVIGPYDDIFNQLQQRVNSTITVRYQSNNLVVDGLTRTVELVFDGCGETASGPGTYLPGESPIILRTPATAAYSATPQLQGTDLLFQAEVTDNFLPYANDIRLYYKVSGSGPVYSDLPMTNISGNLWEVTLPGSEVMDPGLDYYMRAFDGFYSGTDPDLDPSLYPYQIAVLPNEAPVITHAPVTTLTPGVAITISADIVDQTNYIDNAVLRVRRYGDVPWSDFALTNISGDTYSGEIPANFVVAGGLEYEIRATDDYGVSSVDGPHQIIPPACVEASLGAPVWDGATMMVKYPVMLQNLAGHDPVSGIDLILRFDPAVIEGVSAVVSGTILDGAGWGIMWNSPQPGEFRIGLSGSQALATDGILVYTNFHVVQAAGMGDCTDIDMEILLNEGNPCVNISRPSPWCIPPAMVAGTVSFWSCGDFTPIQGVDIVMNDCCYADSAVTDSTGQYSVEGWYGDCYNITPSKTAGETRGISTLDASMVLRNFVGLDPLVNCPIDPMLLFDGTTCPDSVVFPQLVAADVTGNGSIHSFDASMILKYLVGMDVSNTLVGQWGFVCEQRPACIIGNGLSQQDFVGILYGDVSGNYDSGITSVSSSAQLAIGQVSGAPGTTVEVPVEISGADGFYGLQLNINNAPDQAVVEMVIPGTLVQGSLFEWNYTDGSLIIASAGASPITGSGVICTIRYRVDANVSVSVIDLAAGNNLVDENPTPLISEDGFIALGASPVPGADTPKAFALTQIVPNPFNPQTMVSFAVPQGGGFVKIAVYDVMGRLVKELQAGQMDAGIHKILWDGQNQAGSPVPSGAYFCRMEAPGTSDTLKMLLLK